MSDPTGPSNPPIPNLLDSLRSARGRGGRRRGRHGHGPSARTHEAVVQGTDTDAAVSRLSAVEMGYLADRYAGFFVPKTDGPVSRRLPIINRGTYTRTVAIDALIESFIFDNERTGWETEERQIISLGAGTDTRPARYMSLANRPWLVYHEIDFETTCAKKRKIVEKTEMAHIFANPTEDEDGQWWSSRPLLGGEYYCHSMDLRNLTDPSKTKLPGLRTDIPTLILSECCLCYLEPTEASQVLNFFTSQIPSIATVIYEPIKPDDAFGEMMVSNLAARGIRMPTLDIYRESEDQEQRLRSAGFDVVKHLTVDAIWEKWVASEEKERVDRLEGLDEVEEWKLLAGHYIVVWGSKGEGFGSWGEVTGGVKPTEYRG